MPITRRCKKYAKLPDNERSDILAAYASGSSMKEASALFGYSYNVCNWLLKDEGLSPRKVGECSRKYAVDATFFDVIDTEEKAYWLGFILADGYIYREKTGKLVGLGMALASVDLGHLKKFKKALSSEHPIYHEVRSPLPNSLTQEKHHVDRVYISSLKLAKSLGKLGIVPAKSKIVKPFLDFPVELHRHYWRGAVDGDGCIFRQKEKTSGRVSWGVSLAGTEAVVAAFKSFLLANGVKTSAQVRWAGSVFNIAIVGSRVSKQVSSLLWQDATIYLERKQGLYLQLMQAPVTGLDRSDLTATGLLALYTKYKTWTGVAKHLGMTVSNLVRVKRRLGMHIKSPEDKKGS